MESNRERFFSCPHSSIKFWLCLTGAYFSLKAVIFSDKIIVMNAIITVVGSDKVGIIAEVSALLAKHKINIADITQTILSGNFVMMMMVSLEESSISIDELRTVLEEASKKMGVEINIMAEKVFSSMNRI